MGKWMENVYEYAILLYRKLPVARKTLYELRTISELIANLFHQYAAVFKVAQQK